MFCPQCARSQPDDLNYCKSCGTNLQAVRGALSNATVPEDKLDWKKTWLAEAVMTREERDRRNGITPDMKRRREIKAGIVTASTGVSISIVLSILMEAIVINGNLSALAADILSRVWVVGLIPIFVGIALIFNGVFISPKGEASTEAKGTSGPGELTAVDTHELPPAMPFSVTDNTTRHLDEMAHQKKTSSL